MPLIPRPVLPLLLLFALCVVAMPAPARAADAVEVAAVRRLLDDQVAAWNRKDLESYMAGYWKSPELVFFSGGSRTRGWQETLERYRRRYQAEGKEMGTLTFKDLAVELLGPGAALGRGEWRLRMSGGKEVGGLFTVILRKLPEGWRIVHDHSSAD